MQINQLPGYTAIGRIPKGGMTDLFVATDPQGRKVVVRFIRESHAKDRQLRKNFKHGVTLLREFDHPNIIKLTDEGSIHGYPWMAVEYHENQNLRERIAKQSTMLVEHAFALVRQLASALHYLHTRNILHLDLKPENLLILDDVSLILIDFDFAVHHGNKPLRPKKVPGTPAYLAPETLRDHLLDEQSEIFGFGVTMYEMLTLHKPFDSNSLQDYHRAVLDPRSVPHPVHHYRPTISRRLESIILKCLAKNRSERYPSMSLVLRDLEAML